MIDRDTIAERALDVRVRRIGESQMIARGADVRELNDVAAVVWKLANGTRSMHQISEEVVAEYDVGQTEALEDAIEFVSEMVEAGFMQVKQ